MRWADLDLLGHVNNVVYVDYLQEARVDMLLTHAQDRRVDDLAEGVVVVRHEVGYVAPLTLRPSVSIETWVTEIRAASFTIAYEVFTESEEGRVVHARATTLLTPYVFSTERPRRLTDDEKRALERFLEPGDPVRPRRAQPGAGALDEVGHYPVRVRFSDVDVYGHVNNVKYFEYFQEARVVLLDRMLPHRLERGALPVVVAQTDVDYRVPILLRPEPYDMWTEITHVGRSSFVMEARILDSAGGEPVELSRARVVMVSFDPETQRSMPIAPEHRELLLARVAG